MPTRQRRRIAVAAGVAAIMMITGCGAVTESEPETVLIGVDLELTGVGEGLGAIHRQALELRVEQINEQGLLPGRRLELVIRDNRSDPATAALNVADLADDPAVAAVITGACAACAQASAEAVEAREVPLISLTAADSAVGSADQGRYLFKLGPNADDNAAAIIRELTGSGAETVALVASGDAYGDNGVEQMSGAVDRAGLELVLTLRPGLEDTPEQLADSATEIATWAPPPPEFPPPVPEQDPQLGPDAVVLWLPAPQAGQYAQALREVDFEGSLLLDAVAADELFLSGPRGAALEGATLIFTETLVMDTVLATSPAKATRKAWFNSYSARYGTYHAASSFAADAVQLVLEAVNQVGGTDREALRDAIERMQLDGISGPLRLSPDNHSALQAAALITLVASNDRWQPVG